MSLLELSDRYLIHHGVAYPIHPISVKDMDDLFSGDCKFLIENLGYPAYYYQDGRCYPRGRPRFED